MATLEEKERAALESEIAGAYGGLTGKVANIGLKEIAANRKKAVTLLRKKQPKATGTRSLLPDSTEEKTRNRRMAKLRYNRRGRAGTMLSERGGSLG